MASHYRPLPVLLLALVLALAWPAAASAVPPPNDACNQADAIPQLNQTYEGKNNLDATVGGECAGLERTTCGGIGYGRTVWYGVSIPSRGRLTVATSGASSFRMEGTFYLALDTVVGLYTASSFISCNDDGNPSVPDTGSELSAELQPGQYFVQVGGATHASLGGDADTGIFRLTVSYSEDLDRDDDGSSRPSDCNDDNGAVKPGAPDRGVNGIDDNCDGITDPDKDSDGYLARPHGGDCVDTPGAGAGINPGAREVRGNKVDEDCDKKKSPLRRIKADTDYPYNYLVSGIRVSGVFKLTNVPGGARSTLSCYLPRGGPCGRFGPTPKHSFPQMTGKRLAQKSVIIVRVIKRNFIGRYIKITVRTGKKPTKLLRCMNPGSSKPMKKCPGIR
jgi:hypothetical protein